MGNYTKISIILLALAIIIIITTLYCLPWNAVGYSLYALIIIVAIGIIVSLISAIKERTALSIIALSIFLLPVVLLVVNHLASSINYYMEKKKNIITESELLDAYEKISGKRPLCLLNHPDEREHIYLLDVAWIDSDTINDGEILLQYERAELRADNYVLKSLDTHIGDFRDIMLIHYRPCEDDGYSVRYYNRYSYYYEYNNGYYSMTSETDGVDHEWRDGYELIVYDNLLKYYEEHKSEIPVIAEEKIEKQRTHVKFGTQYDEYKLEFETLYRYDDFTVLAEYLQERHGAVISDISEGNWGRSASVKIGESIMTLSHSLYNRNSLEGSLSDRPIMEQIADDFETYMVYNSSDSGRR